MENTSIEPQTLGFTYEEIKTLTPLYFLMLNKLKLSPRECLEKHNELIKKTPEERTKYIGELYWNK